MAIDLTKASRDAEAILNAELRKPVRQQCHHRAVEADNRHPLRRWRRCPARDW